MRTLGNMIWFIFGGFILGTVYALLGLLFCITIIGIPIGKAMFQYSKLMYFPFGKAIVRETFVKGSENVNIIRKIGGFILNLIWLPIGLILFVINLPFILAWAVSIVGIPMAIVLARSSVFLFAPIGAKVIRKEEEQAIITANTMGSRGMISNQASGQPQPQSASNDTPLIIAGVIFVILLLILLLVLALGI